MKRFVYAVLALCGATPIGLSAQTFTTLYNFCAQSGCPDGAYPAAGLVHAADGSWYGTTEFGGAHHNPACGNNIGGCGTVFKITPAGKLTTLYNFCSKSGCTDGATPEAGLVQGADGNFYGTTTSGGANHNHTLCDYGGLKGCGTVFKITASGALTTLHSFCSESRCADGATPIGGLVQAANGDFYGTTYDGGGYGTIFEITPGGTLTTLYSFCAQAGCADGSKPYAGLIQSSDGNFYGTTQRGGANRIGTVFKITPGGILTTLHSFDGSKDGALPAAPLVQAANGELYGTTEDGGAGTYGTVFQITPNGTLTTLYDFCTQSNAAENTGTKDCTDGSQPVAALIQAADGNFYGTTAGGPQSGSFSEGTVFQITPSGTLTTLYSFCSQTGCTDGLGPMAGLAQSANGDFYGTTSQGGAYGYGTVFSVSAGPGVR